MSINPWFIVAVVLLLPIPAHSQRFLFGVKVAGQITNPFPHTELPAFHQDRLLFGPTAEVRVGHGMSVEMDGLYNNKKLEYSLISSFSNSVSGFQFTQSTNTTAHSWDIPLILKWRLPVQPASIVVGGGFAARNAAGMTHAYGTQRQDYSSPSIPFDRRTSYGAVAKPWTYGPVVTAGFDAHAGIFHFQPELRYTRWNDSPFGFVTKMDSFQALIGIAVGNTKQHQ